MAKNPVSARTPLTMPGEIAGVWPSVLRYVLPVCVVALTLACFLPVLTNGFVDWDDGQLLFQNSNYRGLDWPHIRWMFSTFYMGHYQPLTWTTFGLDYLLWGLDPFGYHLTNLVLHCANALLFYFVALRLLLLAGRGVDAHRVSGLYLATALAALLFALHPLRVESVAWITERRDVLSGLFFLATLYCYLQGAERSTARRPWMAAAVIFYLLSLLSKAAGMALPIVLVVLDFYPLRRLASGRWRAPEARRVWLEKIPFVILALVFGVVALLAQRDAG